MGSEATVIVETPELNRFQLVLLAAKRAKEIINGSEPLMASRHQKATSVALDEALAGAIALSSEPPTRVAEHGEEAPEILTPIEHIGKESASGEAEGPSED